MKRNFLVAMSALLVIGSMSCKKSGGGGSTTPSKTESVLIKVTVTPAPTSANQVSITGSCNAMLPNLNFATWKVNGTVRANEDDIGFTAADLVNGVITLETTADVTQALLDLGGVSVGSNTFTVQVQATLNGVAQTPVSIPVSGVMSRDFKF